MGEGAKKSEKTCRRLLWMIPYSSLILLLMKVNGAKLLDIFEHDYFMDCP